MGQCPHQIGAELIAERRNREHWQPVSRAKLVDAVNRLPSRLCHDDKLIAVVRLTPVPAFSPSELAM
jgi:hypothetical protein